METRAAAETGTGTEAGTDTRTGVEGGKLERGWTGGGEEKEIAPPGKAL